MNLRSRIIIVIIASVIIFSSLYFAYVLINQPEDVVQQGDEEPQGDNNQTAINEKREEIKSRIVYPNSNNDSTVNISYDFKKIPNDYSQNILMDSLEDDVNSF